MQSLDNFINLISSFAEKAIYFIVFSFLFYISFYIIKESVKKFRNYSPNTVNGFILLIELIQLSFWVIAALLIFDITDPSILIGGSALLVTIISLSSSSFGSNIVGGLYIILTRPFGIGDLINYNNNIGIVSEIGLNYTKILRLNRKIVSIPNGLIINTNILNFNVLSRYVTKEKNESEVTKKIKFQTSDFISITQKITTPILDTLNQDEVIRFSFPLEIRIDEMKQPVTLKNVIDGISETLKQFTSNFGFEPEFYINDYSFRLSITIILTAKSPKTIYDYHPLIIEKLALKFFDFKKEISQ